MSGSLIGLCPIISDNENRFLLVSLDGRSQNMSHLLSRPGLQQRSQRASLQPSVCFPSAPNHVFLERLYCSVLALPLSLCLLRVSFRLPFCLDMLPRLALTIGLCPINSDNNDSFCLFDWIVPECGSSEFRRAASALQCFHRARLWQCASLQPRLAESGENGFQHSQPRPNTAI